MNKRRTKPPATKPPSHRATKTINLALQGGGAHGAYSWGVLDRLLEEEKLSIEGISGTSAGAMNGAMLVNGYMKGGREGAKECLEQKSATPALSARSGKRRSSARSPAGTWIIPRPTTGST